jgi:hypothetical protein
MPLRRKINWDSQELERFFRERRDQPFAWGTNDCCIFPADAILAITGTDIAEDWFRKDGRARYVDEASAFALIKSVTGGETVADAAAWCAEKFGLVEWLDKAGKPAPLFAQRGDLVVLEDAGRMIAGVVGLTGKHVVSVGEAGLKRLPLSAVQRAWRV